MPNDLETIKVVAKGREGILFDGPAVSLSSINSSGPFDILPKHANFISLIKDHVVIIKPDKSAVKIKVVDQAVLRVYQNSVYIYLGISPLKDGQNIS